MSSLLVAEGSLLESWPWMLAVVVFIFVGMIALVFFSFFRMWIQAFSHGGPDFRHST